MIYLFLLYVSFQFLRFSPSSATPSFYYWNTCQSIDSPYRVQSSHSLSSPDWFDQMRETIKDEGAEEFKAWKVCNVILKKPAVLHHTLDLVVETCDRPDERFKMFASRMKEKLKEDIHLIVIVQSNFPLWNSAQGVYLYKQKRGDQERQHKHKNGSTDMTAQESAILDRAARSRGIEIEDAWFHHNCFYVAVDNYEGSDENLMRFKSELQLHFLLPLNVLIH